MPRLPVDGDKEMIALSPYSFVVDGNVVDLPAIRIDTPLRSSPRLAVQETMVSTWTCFRRSDG
jgi:hypothetical protein